MTGLEVLDPFGDTLRSTGPRASANPWRFSTKDTDQESGWLYYGYRYYAPKLGRWVSRDRAAEHGGLNIYAAFLNDAVCRYDVLGLITVTVISDSTCGGDNLVWSVVFGLQSPNRAAAFTGISSPEEFLSACESAVRDKGERITQLNLSGHGGAKAAGVSFSGGYLDINKFSATQRQRLRNVLAAGATLTLYVCEAAATQGDKRDLQKASDTYGVCIKATDGSCQPGPDGWFLTRWIGTGIRHVVGWWTKQPQGQGWIKFQPQDRVPCPGGRSDEVRVVGRSDVIPVSP
jgi:RHS repeat-associated protein